MSTQTTRRALLGGAGLAAAVAIVPAVASVRTPAVATTQWDALVTVFHKADANMKAIGAEHDEAYKRYSLALAKLGPRPQAPDYSDKAYLVPIGQMTIGELSFASSTKSPKYAAYEAALADWKAAAATLEAEVAGDVDARWETAVDVQDKAAHALFEEPSPNADALHFKMQLVERSYEGGDMDSYVTKAIFADVRRLLSKEA
ncbi:hypothetical protein [Sphingomonas faeni]|uniref:hypothetical protein n=1 Tax=Sphingomonas faeni TaxID=185950 RepID=UPI003364329C